MENNFKVEVDRNSKVPVMHLSGDITAFSDETINDTYKAIEFNDAPVLIISFKQVKYINSGGIATLVGIVTDMVDKKGTLKFAELAPHYQKVVDIVGITKYVELYNTVDDALANIKK